MGPTSAGRRSEPAPGRPAPLPHPPLPQRDRPPLRRLDPDASGRRRATPERCGRSRCHQRAGWRCKVSALSAPQRGAPLFAASERALHKCPRTTPPFFLPRRIGVAARTRSRCHQRSGWRCKVSAPPRGAPPFVAAGRALQSASGPPRTGGGGRGAPRGSAVPPPPPPPPRGGRRPVLGPSVQQALQSVRAAGGGERGGRVARKAARRPGALKSARGRATLSPFFLHILGTGADELPEGHREVLMYPRAGAR